MRQPGNPLSAPTDDDLVTDEIRLRAYVEAALGGILAVDSRGRVVFMNGHSEQMFGYPREEIMGQNLMLLAPRRFQGDYTSALQSYFTAPSVRLLGMEMGLVAQRKNGEEFPVEIGLSFVHGHAGPIALGFVTDVTGRKKSREELARINAELVRSNTDLDLFAHLVAHDLQEPLRVITSYLSLLDRRYSGKASAEAEELIQPVLDGASRMKAQIESLLHFSSVGTVASTSRKVSGALILKAALENLKVAIGERSAEVTSDPLPEIVADPVLLAEVFQNLIGNAIKFNQDRIPRVHVSAQQRDTECVFSVRDNGIGIDGRDSERAFKMFGRLHAKDEYPGTGLGLMISRKILERHQGRIWFESKPGEGTTFYFSIPAADEAVSQTSGH